MKTFTYAICVFSVFCGCSSKVVEAKTKPKISKDQAIAIAEKELEKRYGKSVRSQRPFQATLEGNVWKVEGTLHCEDEGQPGVVCMGGVGYVDLSSDSGAILKVEHEK